MTVPNQPPPDLPVVVIGAGPVGLAAAAHLAERDIDFLVLESGGAVGAGVRQWGHVRLFSPWRYNIDPAARRLLEQAGWSLGGAAAAATERAETSAPTGAELVEGYLVPLAATPSIAPHIRLGHRVVAISRVGMDRIRSAGRASAPFLVRVESDGRLTDLHARAIIDATGTWDTPNVLGASGLPARGETEASASIDQALPDILGTARALYAGRHTLVIGSGHSAANTLLALAELAEQAPGTRITWAIRTGSAARSYGGGDADALPARGKLGTRVKNLVADGCVELITQFSADTIRTLTSGSDSDHATVEVTGTNADGTVRTIAADRIIGATGFRPDHTLTAELRLDLDPVLGSTRALAPLIDPNQHSCGTVPPHGADELAHPEPGYYAIGAKSYGRAPTFLLATGYEQARSVVAALAGDWDAARDVQLELPETGVCSTSLPGEPSCCGTSEPESNTATASASKPIPIGLPTGASGGLLAQPLAIVTTSGGNNRNGADNSGSLSGATGAGPRCCG